MVLGMSLATFTLVHVLISLVGIAAGLIVIERLLRNRALGLSNTIFLVTTIATSVTGFLFPFKAFTPAHAVGIISLVILAVSLFALYAQHLAGPWRWVYVVTAIVAQWFNVFVLIVQSFQKIPSLKTLAPTQSEPPFQIAQGAALVLLVVLAILAVRKFRPVAA